MASAKDMLALADGADVVDEAIALAGEMLGVCRDELLGAVRFANRPMAQLPARIQTDRTGCMTDGRAAWFSAGFVLSAFGKSRPLVSRAYLHMIVHCLLCHPFAPADVDPLAYSVACDLSVACILQELDCAQIAYADAERDAIVATWASKVQQPTAAAFYALIIRENTPQEELGRIEMTIGMDSHEQWFAQPDDGQEQAEQDAAEAMQQLAELWEKIATATQMDAQREDSQVSPALANQLHQARAKAMGLEELLRAYAAPHETMVASEDDFDLVYYSYGLRELSGIALVEPLEYCETPRLRDFCVAIDTSGSCSGPIVEAFVAKACGMLLESGTVSEKTRIWLVQCDNAIQDQRVVTLQDDIEHMLGNLEIKGLGGTDFRPVFEMMEQKLEEDEVDAWEALVYFTDGQGEFPREAPPWDTAFVFLDEAGDAPAWASKAVTYTDELIERGAKAAGNEE